MTPKSRSDPTRRMKILLIQPPNTSRGLLALGGQEIPLSLAYLASSLKHAGFPDVGILDLAFRNLSDAEYSRAVFDFQPDLVGLTAYTHNVEFASRLAALAKEANPRTATILGGFHASALPERTLREESAFDYVAVGEGEATVVELARALRDLDEVPAIDGLARRVDDEVRLGPVRAAESQLDDLPFPDRTLIPVASYMPDPGNYYRLPSTGILYSRGCPYKCTYCSKSVFLDRVRFRSPENFLAEVGECDRSFGIRDFRLEDEGPTVAPKKIAALCEAILDRGVDITWNCFSRVDRVDAEMLRLMSRAGCYHITYGVESTDDAELKNLKKNICFEEARSAVRMTRRHGIEAKVNFILGFPWQDMNDCKKTVRDAIRLAPDLVSFNVFKPLPGSPLFDDLDRARRIHHSSWEDYSIDTEKLLFEAKYTEAQMRALVRWANLSFYFRPATVARRFLRMLRHPKRELKTVLQGLGVLLTMARKSLGSKSPSNTVLMGPATEPSSIG
ncbi:MAG: cobalamin-dependent protein [Deltaproteobacteria bacterium]|nr:cobalamin-dependent protein [Deltaproteobacteria bacterium]